SAAFTISALASASLERICSAHRWQFAQVWHPDERQENLTCAGDSVWNAAQFAEFHRVSVATAIKLGDDLPGRVWDIKTANWFEDIGFGKFSRLEAARRAGLKTAMVFPVILGDEVL